MITILDAFAVSPEGQGLPEAAMLNYWGFGYRTYLAEVFASMFPDRVRRVVLDGVVDPISAVTGVDTSSIVNMDGVISTFFIYCHLAGPQLCPYYTGTTAKDIPSFREHSCST
jgi:pimeloyl-ACP methyl ester carboxylesterase